MTAIQFVYENILSIAMMVLLICAGFFLSARLGFLQFRKFGAFMKGTIGSLFDKSQHKKDKNSVSPFQAVATALAGTIGTGSIAGVATALVSGGPGAIFWMWISALVGMITKYSEIVLSLRYREKDASGAWRGGPMYYIKNGLGKRWRWLAAMFAVFAMIACIGTGNLTQSNSIAVAAENTFSIAPWITGIVLTAIVAVVILGGVKRIASINEKLVPIMAIFFILASIVALSLNVTRIPHAFAIIFEEAFNFKAAFGGVAGFGIMKAMRFGVGRGVFTNEAGLGSAPIAHSASSTDNPVKQGMWGVFEVFITTIIICTMSALVILTSTKYLVPLSDGSYLSGPSLSAAAFGEAIPYVGEIGIAVATVFFALSTMLGWAYYGEVCAGYLCKKRANVAIMVYRIIYAGFVFVGAIAELDLVWLVADCFNALMALPNLIALVLLSGVVVSITREHFSKKKLPKIDN